MTQFKFLVLTIKYVYVKREMFFNYYLNASHKGKGMELLVSVN